ncbi:MAG: pyridoxal-phosphate dependent enzyme, partial [Roseovarius sp.]|nr:pyridoxal-phosphate dependent enzyme [Roseovarius sp.]
MNWQTEIQAARARIALYLRRTPAMEVSGFGLPATVELKFEQMQLTGSFKVRGAFNTALAQPVPAAGLVAASGGNHGAAVAHAGARLGHRVKVFVPGMAGPAKIALIERAGADLTVVPGAYANALDAARAYEAETGAMPIHAYDA